MGGVLVVGIGLGVVAKLSTGSYVIGQGIERQQPIPFSHEHHVRGLGIDCRYCHTSVEESSFAGIPSTKTCMTCHSQIWTNAEVLEPLRQAYKSGKPIAWTRVHRLPGHVYFNHSIHVAKGVACTSCHGDVDRMPMIYQVNTLQMAWCLNCHRHPGNYVGPKGAVFKTSGSPAGGVDPEEANATGSDLVKKYKIKNTVKMADCYTCHR